MGLGRATVQALTLMPVASICLMGRAITVVAIGVVETVLSAKEQCGNYENAS